MYGAEHRGAEHRRLARAEQIGSFGYSASPLTVVCTQSAVRLNRISANSHARLSPPKLQVYQVPLRAETYRGAHPHLICSAPVLNWGTVALGDTQCQRLLVRNRSTTRSPIFHCLKVLFRSLNNDSRIFVNHMWS
jgi:hypothetical protein